MRLAWHILRMHIGPFFFGTAVVVFIFLLQFIYKFLNDLVGKGLTYWVITKFIIYNMAWMLVLAVPMGALFASLMAYGKLSANNELTIVKSSGGSAFRAMIPAILAGLCISYALYFFNDRILPETNHMAYVLQNDIKQLKPTFAIDPGQFSTLQGYSILARDVNREKNILEHVTIYQQNGQKLNVINANDAELSFNRDQSKMMMTLHDGEVHELDRRNMGLFRKIVFHEYHVIIQTSGYNFNQSDPSSFGRTDRTMNIGQMREVAQKAEKERSAAAAILDSLLRNQHRVAAVDSLPASGVANLSRHDAASAALSNYASLRSQIESQSLRVQDRKQQANQYWVEIHKKYSIPVACLVFILVGAPLGIVVRRGNFGVSASIALGFFVIYWASLVTGEKLADRDVLSPAVAMWMADTIVGIIGVYLIILVSRETVTFSFDFSRIRAFFSRTKQKPSV